MRVACNKLVRDRIPEIIAATGRQPVTRVLDHPSYHKALIGKLAEEAREAADASPDDLPGELADILEVIKTLATTIGMTWDELQALAAAKQSQRGGFSERIFLQYVEDA